MLKFSFVIFLSILLLSHFSNGQQQDGSVLEKRISLNEKNQTLSFILDQISWQAGVYFSYDATDINPNRKFSVDVTDKSVFTVLNQLFNHSEFGFTERENQIIIFRKTNGLAPNQVLPDSIPVKYFFLTGKIIDDKKGDPVRFASLSLRNKPIGTITNNDGEFLLKIHPENIYDTLIISCMGFSQIILPAFELLDEDLITMETTSIKIREVKVTATTPAQLLENIRRNLEKNYSSDPRLMTAFYRETVQQDGRYISVSEAVVEILKAPYVNTLRNDLVRLIKGRRSPDVQPFQWLNFKLQGGPFTITKLDVVKTFETFLDEKYESSYSYNITKSIWYNENPVYVLTFKPVPGFLDNGYVGEMYVHRETFAIVYIHFYLDRNGLKNAEEILIKKKPKGVRARPTYVHYHVNYQQYNGYWQLANAQASVKFKVRSRRDKINSEYHSVSDLLVTDIQSTELKRFPREEQFRQRDIFVEMIGDYDPDFWENYNIIKPDEELKNAVKNHLLN